MADTLIWKHVSELSPGMLQNQSEAVLSFRLGSKKMALAQGKGGWVAFPARCPHSGGPLNAGWMDDGAVVCPWHRFAFDLENGQCRNSGFAIICHPIKIEDGKVWVGIRKKKWGLF